MFTCIICEFKFDESDYDLDERMCYDCLYEYYKTEDEDEINV